MGNEFLERKIDTNKDGIQSQELTNFLKDEKNIQELGTHLNKVGINRSDLLYATSQNEIKKFIPAIDQKVKANLPLTQDEKNLMKIQYIIEKKVIPDSESALNNFIGTKFNNQFYNVKSESSSVSIYPKGISESLKNREWNNKFPVIHCREGYANQAIDDLTDWIKNHDFVGYDKARKLSETKNSNKKNPQDYVKYDLAVYAFDRYSEIINTEDNRIKKLAGYSNDKEFESDMKVLQDLSSQMGEYKQKNFPNIDKTIDQYASYNKDMEIATKESGYTTIEEENKATEKYMKFHEEVSLLAKEKNISELSNQINNSDFNSSGGLETYFNNTNKIVEYTNQYEGLKAKYGSQDILKHEKNLTNIQKVMQKYGKENIIKWGSDIQAYYRRMDVYKKGYARDVNWDKVDQYNSLVAKSDLLPYKETLYKLSTIVDNPAGAKGPFYGLQYEQKEKEKSQAKVDKYWLILKTVNPALYQQLNFGSGAWNGAVDFVVGTLSSLSLMITKLWKTDEERLASADFKEQVDGFLKFKLSTEQSKPPIDENGNRNLGLDNTVNLVGSQVANMLALLSGGRIIASGVKLGSGAMLAATVKSSGSAILGTVLKGAINVAPKIGLFSMAFIQNVGRSFEEGIKLGLSGSEALSYTMLQSALSSGLELVSPNEMIMGSGKKVAQEYIKNILKGESKQGFLQVSKIFLKDIGSEILEENIQEAMQLAVGNVVNLRANDKWDVKFSADFSLENFGTTALLTTLTTGLASSKQALINANLSASALSGEQVAKIKQGIIKDPNLYQDIMKVIEGIKSNKIRVQGVDIVAIIALELELKKGLGVENKQIKSDSKGEVITTGDKNFPAELQKAKEEIQLAITSGNTQKLGEIMKGIRSNRANFQRKDAMLTLKNTASIYKADMKQEIEMLRDNIHTNPELAFKGLQMISANGLKLGIVLFGVLPLPIPGNKAILLGLFATEFKTKGPLYQAIMEVYEAVSERGISENASELIVSENILPEASSELVFENKTGLEILRERSLSLSDMNSIEGRFLQEQKNQYEEGLKNATKLGKKALKNFEQQFVSAMKMFDNNTKLKIGIEELSINEYIDSFLNVDGFTANQKAELKLAIMKLGFSQTVDNPKHLNSHGFDHSLQVTNFLKQNIENNPQDIEDLQKKYGITKGQAEFLYKLSGIAHDFGYPPSEILGFDKPSHGLLGAILFEKTFNGMEFWVNFPQSERDSIKKAMFESILYHSADKREKNGFLVKVKFGDAEILLGEVGKRGNNTKGLETLKKYIEVHGKTEIKIEYISELAGSQQILKDIRAVLKNMQLETKNGKESLNVTFSDLGSSPKYKKGNGELIQNIEGFLGRYVNGKNVGIGLEFKVADIESDPILKHVRDADNLDMTWRRLVGEQGEGAFMDVIYSIGSNTKNGKIIDLIEEYQKSKTLEEKIAIKNELIQNFSEIEVSKLKKNSIVVDQKKTFNIDRSMESNLSLNSFKLLLLENIKGFDYSTEGEQSWSVIENVLLNEKVNGFSMRHMGGLFAIENAVDVGGKYEIIVNDENYLTMYNDPSFNVEEDGVTINMALYHTWRLFSAIQHNTRGGKTPVIEIRGKNGNIIAKTREVAKTEQGINVTESKNTFELVDMDGNIYKLAI